MCNNKRFAVLRLIFAMFGLIPAVSSASSLPPALVITQPGLVAFSEDRDRDTRVNLRISTQPLRNSGYEFGYMEGGVFSFISSGRGKARNLLFQSDTAVDFALRYKGADGLFGTSDDTLFRMSDPANQVTQQYSDPSRGRKHDDSLFYHRLTLGWDLNHDGVTDLSVVLATRTRHAGLHYSPAVIPVPVPAALWLFGSGLAGLFACARRRKPA